MPTAPPDPPPPLAQTITVVGPGRLGGAVARQLSDAGWAVTVVARGEAIPRAPLTWLTVPDRDVASAAAATPPGGIVLHAAGALDVAVLHPHIRAGSLHPLMSFAEAGAPPPLVTAVPAAIAGHPHAVDAARTLADCLGWQPFEVQGDRRLYHAAAVLAGNFATALLAEAARVLAAAGVPSESCPDLLAPLALRSIQNAAAMGPAAALTGPVARGDNAVIGAHLEALNQADPAALAVYQVLLEAARRLRQPVT
jgi:predicted short-subunit dehydrogenase-like oxidoreductase (DUF2520 family)